MDEMIFKQAAIDELNRYYSDKKYIARSRTILSAICLDIKRTLQDLPAVNRWIPCKERLPKEKDSIFARFYGTPKWNKSMFRKRSQKVLVTVVYPNGKRGVDVNHTTDGEWYKDPLSEAWDVKTVAWMPFPEPYKEEEGEL